MFVIPIPGTLAPIFIKCRTLNMLDRFFCPPGLVFGVASLLSRGARFFFVAGLLWYFGPPIRNFIERRLGLVTLVFSVLLVAGFVILAFVLR